MISNETVILQNFNNFSVIVRVSNFPPVSYYSNENLLRKKTVAFLRNRLSRISSSTLISNLCRKDVFVSWCPSFLLFPILWLASDFTATSVKRVVVPDNALVYRSPQTTISGLVLPSLSQLNIDPCTAINNQSNYVVRLSCARFPFLASSVRKQSATFC